MNFGKTLKNFTIIKGMSPDNSNKLKAINKNGHKKTRLDSNVVRPHYLMKISIKYSVQ